MYSSGHKHVTDVKLVSTVVFLNRITVVTGTVNIGRSNLNLITNFDPGK